MRRRDFIKVIVASTAIGSHAARAQQPDRVWRIGVLRVTWITIQMAIARISAFQKALRELGWDEGRNLQIDTRWGVDDDRIPGTRPN